jgi:hypothetical protein
MVAFSHPYSPVLAGRSVMQVSRVKKEHLCDLCGAVVPREDVITRVAEAPFGLCCSECRDQNYHQHRLRMQSVTSGFAADDTRTLRRASGSAPQAFGGPSAASPSPRPSGSRSRGPKLELVSASSFEAPVPADAEIAEQSSPWLALPEALDADVSWITVKSPLRMTRSNRVRVRAKSGRYFLDFGASAEDAAGGAPTLHYSTIELPRSLARKLAEHLMSILWEDEAGPLPQLPRIAA